MSEHLIKVHVRHKLPRRDRAKIKMSCPDCDLTVLATIGPASMTDYFIQTITTAHLQQIAIGETSIAINPGRLDVILSLRLDGENATALRAIANKRNCNVSDLLREGAEHVIQQHRTQESYEQEEKRREQ